jgi:hypothetical protein
LICATTRPKRMVFLSFAVREWEKKKNHKRKRLKKKNKERAFSHHWMAVFDMNFSCPIFFFGNTYAGYQRRSDPSFVKLRESIKDGKLGRVQIVKTMSRDHPVPSINFLKISGGIFHDCGR